MSDTYNFPEITRGDTHRGTIFEFLDDDGAPLDLTGAAVSMQLRYGSRRGELGLELSTADGDFVVAPLLGTITLLPFEVAVQVAGKYFYDIEIVFQGGRTKTYVGGTWLIKDEPAKVIPVIIQKRGDTFDGLDFEILISDEPLDLTGSTIEFLIFSGSYGGPPVETPGPVPVTITNPALGQFTAGPFLTDFDHDGRYFYKALVTIMSGQRKTYVGGPMQIIDDVTRV